MNIKNPAFIGALGLITLVLGGTGFYMATHPAPTPFNPEAQTALETDTPERIDENTEHYTIEVTYPTKIQFPLSSRSDAGAEAERVIREWVDTNIAQFKAYAGENEAAIADFVARGEEVPASLSSMYLAVTYEKTISPRTLTYVFSSASYTGGAHGIEVPVTFTFDRTSGSQLTLNELFMADTDYLARLSALARAKLPSLTGDFTNPEFILSGTEPDPKNFGTFYLQGDDLVFLFPPYQVAPYAAGTIVFRINRSELNDILRPEYRRQ